MPFPSLPRTWRGWLILIALVALNEARGLAVVAAVLKVIARQAAHR